MTDLYKYRIWCETESTWVSTWEEELPSVCPNNNEHTIDSDKTIISKQYTELPPQDRSGKTRVHQTSRKLGTVILWTGKGDDPSDLTNIGDGNSFILEHTVGSGMETSIYIDFNMVENETWMHEGYITWKNGEMDSVTLEMVSRSTETQAGTNTFYNPYGNVIIPAAGDGVLDITGDITHPNGGLIYCPDNDLGEPPLAFWNADYNSTTKLYENISAAPSGDGRYNMFTAEHLFAKFLNNMPLLGNGFIALNSSDTDQLGHGMRLKMTGRTSGDDHDWSCAALMCMHRAKTV